MMLATQYHYRVTWNKVPKVSISFIDFMEGGWGLTCRKWSSFYKKNRLYTFINNSRKNEKKNRDFLIYVPIDVKVLKFKDYYCISLRIDKNSGLSYFCFHFTQKINIKFIFQMQNPNLKARIDQLRNNEEEKKNKRKQVSIIDSI